MMENKVNVEITFLALATVHTEDLLNGLHTATHRSPLKATVNHTLRKHVTCPENIMNGHPKFDERTPTPTGSNQKTNSVRRKPVSLMASAER